MSCIAEKKGFILITILMFFVLLTVIVAVYLFVSTIEMRQAGNNLDDAKALALAEAGIERGVREIRDDVLATTQIGTADLRGNTTSGTAGTAASRNTIRYYNEGATLIMTAVGVGTYVILQDYDRNYLNTAIKNVKIGCRYRKATSGGNNPSLEVLYTTNGTFPQAGNSNFLAIVNSTSFNISPFIVLDITNDRVWTWSDINNANFRIRARAYNSSNRNVIVDYLFLQVTYEIDTNTERWATGGFATFPVNLGDGSIESISITAEQGKVHLNTAAQALLRYLMFERGIPSATANTLATNIVTYRASKYFDSIEELKQVTGITSVYYDLIKDFITVYSFINPYATRPTANRAPVNINTASREVLLAIFDPLGLAATDPASLATDIINTRATSPFTCFYSSNSSTDFYDFIMGRSYLTAAERNRVLDNADASPLIPVSGFAGYNAVTTEFSYDTNSFLIDAVGKKSDSTRRVKTIIEDNGNRYLDTYIGDTTLTKYWREIAQ